MLYEALYLAESIAKLQEGLRATRQFAHTKSAYTAAGMLDFLESHRPGLAYVDTESKPLSTEQKRELKATLIRIQTCLAKQQARITRMLEEL